MWKSNRISEANNNHPQAKHFLKSQVIRVREKILTNKNIKAIGPFLRKLRIRMEGIIMIIVVMRNQTEGMYDD